MASSFTVDIYHCYEWRDPNTEEERWLKKAHMKAKP